VRGTADQSLMTDIKPGTEELRKQKQEEKQARRAAKQAKHEEMLREHAIQRELKQKKKAENKQLSEQKRIAAQEQKKDKENRELTINVDMKALQNAVSAYFSKFGKIQQVETIDRVPFGAGIWSVGVTFERKEDMKNAVQKPGVQIPVSFDLEQVPIEDQCVHFEYQWIEKNVATWKPSGPAWEELKKEIIRVFSAKLPAGKPTFVSYTDRRVVVNFASTTHRDAAVHATKDNKHNWIVQTKAIPALTSGLPPRKLNLKRKKEEKQNQGQSGSSLGQPSKMMKVETT